MAERPGDGGQTVHRLDPTAVEWRLVDDEVIALDLRSSRYIALNPTGAALWQALAKGASAAQLVDRLTAEFSVDTDRAAADVDAFLGEMHERGLLERG